MRHAHVTRVMCLTLHAATDFIVVIISVLSKVLSDLPGISILRLLRVFRVLRLFPRYFQVICFQAADSWPSCNIESHMQRLLLTGKSGQAQVPAHDYQCPYGDPAHYVHAIIKPISSLSVRPSYVAVKSTCNSQERLLALC